MIDAGGNTGFAAGANTRRGGGARRSARVPEPRRDGRAGFRRGDPRAAGRRARLGCVDGARDLGRRERRQHERQRRPLHRHRAGAGRAGCHSRGRRRAHEVPFLSGACMAVPRAVWERHGGFAERVLHVPRGSRLLAARAARRRTHRHRAGGARRPRLRVPQGAGEVALPGAQPPVDDRARCIPGALLLLLLPALLATELALLVVAVGRRLGSAEAARRRAVAAGAAAPARAAPRDPARACDQRRRVRALADAGAVLAAARPGRADRAACAGCCGGTGGSCDSRWARVRSGAWRRRPDGDELGRGL